MLHTYIDTKIEMTLDWSWTEINIEGSDDIAELMKEARFYLESVKQSTDEKCLEEEGMTKEQLIKAILWDIDEMDTALYRVIDQEEERDQDFREYVHMIAVESRYW